MNNFPLFPRHAGRDIVYADGELRLTRDSFLAMARALAARLPEQAHCLNLCDDRLPFLLGFCAALMRRQCTLLPASRTEASLAALAASHPGITAVSDRPQAYDGIKQLQVAASALAQSADSMEDEAVPPATLAAELFTSGSTGAPQPHLKTWAMLAEGARILAEELKPGGTLLGSVPSQHMFGLESTILLPMQAGLTLAGGCPLLPQDIQSAMQGINTPIWWATTPLHLRACVQSGLGFPKLAGIVCATQTLAPELARAAEDCFQAPLHEIYGCTEAGAIGIRRTAQTETWRLLPDWEMTSDAGTTQIRGLRSAGAFALPDHIAQLDARHFRLLGRHASLIKVGGKRMHLDALNQILQAVPGVADGVFYQPAEGARLMALVVADKPDSAGLLAALRKAIDPVFLPRPIHWVDALPRNAAGKLPAETLQKFVETMAR